MATNKVAEIARLRARPGKRGELLAVLQRMVDEAEGQPGTEIYVFHEATDDDVTIWTYELYRDRAARVEHGQSPAMGEIGPAIGSLLDGPPELFPMTPAIGKGIAL